MESFSDASSASINEEITYVDLTQISGEGPAAVLLVDLVSRSIVYANAVAQQMAPGITLPALIDDWSNAAVLRDLDGAELSDTNHPLSLIARAHPVSGQGVSAARETELGQIREPMWVVALPLDGAEKLDNHGLVVFLPFKDRDQAQSSALAEDAHARLGHRAVLASGMSFTVADARAEDIPLIWVNPAFTATTGYAFEEAVGRNCRFLQGLGTDPEAHLTMRKAIASSEEIDITVLNYRKDGTAFWNQISMNPILNPEGELTHYVGIQTDVTGRVLADRERDLALSTAQKAQKQAEAAEKRVLFLAEATSQLSESLDVAKTLDRLCELAVPFVSDGCVVTLFDTDETCRQSHTVFNGSSDQFLDLLQQVKATTRAAADAAAAFEDLLAFQDNRVVSVALDARGRVGGVITFLRSAERNEYSANDLTVLRDLGRRAALIIDNARLYEREHTIAETLQNSLLPEMPSVDGLTIATSYVPTSEGAFVGGDFYEAIEFNDGSLGFAVGDVSGHDIRAAAEMGHLRGLLRACAWEDLERQEDKRQDPGKILDCVDNLVRGLKMSTLATLSYGRIAPNRDGSWDLSYASAGHMPLILRAPDGSVEILNDVYGLMIGVSDDRRSSQSRVLSAGSTVVAYTDGLVERRGEDLSIGLDALASTVASGPANPHQLRDHILQQSGQVREDDTALCIIAVT